MTRISSKIVSFNKLCTAKAEKRPRKQEQTNKDDIFRILIGTEM
jgi:hypothetical protein